MQYKIIGAAVLAFGISIAAGTDPALAAYGALAHDDETGKYGLSSNEETQGKADDVAKKECGTGKCKIVFPMGPRMCGSIATEEEQGTTAWGAGRKPDRAAAELDAVKSCQKRTKGQCKVRNTECNR
jgi:hypothetical protein